MELPDPDAPPLEPDPAPLTTLAPGPRRRVSMLTVSIAVVAILAGSALFVSGYSLGRQAAADPGTPASEGDAFAPFWETYHSISDRYAGGTVDRTTVIQGAIRGMIESLGDPYSAYLSADDYRRSLQGISGQFEGIGAEITSRARDGTEGCTPLGADCLLVVTRPLPGSPAEMAGIRPDDIVAVGRRDVARRADRGRSPRPDPRPEGQRRLDRRAPRDESAPARDHPRCRPGAGGRDASRWPTAAVGLPARRRASPMPPPTLS